MIKKIAQNSIDLYNGGGYKGFGPLGLETTTAKDAPDTFSTLVSTSIGFISIIAIIWFVFIIISSGIAYMSAGADTKATEGARKRITNGLIGLLITIFGIFIINLVGQIFNIPNILNLSSLLNLIKIQ